MNKKKIIWIILLIIIVLAAILGIIFAKPMSNSNNSNTATFNKNSNIIENIENKNDNNESVNSEENSGELDGYKKIELEDGTLYSLSGSKVKPDIIIGTNFFATTINDIYLNPKNYMNKKIQIEGMYLLSEPYTFVGRYSNSNICAYCPVGYSYLEYQLSGTIDKEFEDEKDWIKLVGTIEKANDESSGFQDYYYLKVLTLEVMNERGQDTVNN